MTRFWMMGGVAIAVSVGVMAWSPRPTPASEDLLRKAQSEFAIKARDALIQRRMALAPTSALPSPSQPYMVASLEPVAPPRIAIAETPAEAAGSSVTSSARSVAGRSCKMSRVARAAGNSGRSEGRSKGDDRIARGLLPAPPAAAAAKAMEPVPAVAAAPELAAVSTQVVAPMGAAPPQPPRKLAPKARRTPTERSTKSVARRSGTVGSRDSMPYNLRPCAHARRKSPPRSPGICNSTRRRPSWARLRAEASRLPPELFVDPFRR